MSLAAATLLVTWLLPSTDADVAFAEVQQKLDSVDSVALTVTYETEGIPPRRIRRLLLRDFERRELANGDVIITDMRQRKMMTVSHQRKAVEFREGMSVFKSWDFDGFINGLAYSERDIVRKLPPKDIDGKRATGFVLETEQVQRQCWVDPESKLLVRIEWPGGKDKENRTARSYVSDFVYNEQFDPSLFALEPPAGYSVRTVGYHVAGAVDYKPDSRGLVLRPDVGIGPIRFGMSLEEAVKALGNPDYYTTRELGLVNLRYVGLGMEILVQPGGAGVCSIRCSKSWVASPRYPDFQGKTDKGISLGSSMADVRLAYGDGVQTVPSFHVGRGELVDLIYNPGESELGFQFHEDAVTQVTAHHNRPRVVRDAPTG